jgi:pimeloyl-ACP methyl ester carboxylesterase
VWWLGLVIVVVAACSSDPLVPMSPRLALAPCPPADNIEDGLCGTWDVFEDREAQTGRRIGLRVVVLPALSTDIAPDPLFILAGGPGQAASELTDIIRVPFRQVNRERDLVFVDQRGTGGSNPLTCELGEDAPDETLLLDPMSDELLRAQVVEQLGACVASLDADPRLYTTPLAMDDLDDVREALGYDTINLWGGSYGTRAGLVYLRRHPDRVRTAILDGVAPVAMKLPLYMGMDAARALDLMLEDCAADAGCHAAYPDLGAELQTLLDTLAQGPVRSTLAHARTGRPTDVVVSRTSLASSVRAPLYSPDLAVVLPLAISRAAAGDYGPLSAMGVGFAGDASLYTGMFLSVVCSEDVPGITADDRAMAAAEPLFGTSLLDSFAALCGAWPRGTLPDGYDAPVASDRPVLLLSGLLDPVTPPRWAESVQGPLGISNATHIIVPGVGHGTMGAGCVPDLMAEFIDQGSAATLDVACVDRIERPRFFDSSLGPGTFTVEVP